jgi:hypothetical protein
MLKADNGSAVIDLPKIEHTYHWVEFSVSEEKPYSDDRRYKLLKVYKNGNVDLIDCAVADIGTHIVSVKTETKDPVRTDKPQTIYVVDFDHGNQTATIRQLRMKPPMPNKS